MGGSEENLALEGRPQPLDPTRVFVVPNPRLANASFTLTQQVERYDQLAPQLAENPTPPVLTLFPGRIQL
jgi:hypothetical protein